MDRSKTVPAIVHQVLRSSGRPLDPATRAEMEPRFGHDFGAVRVHTDSRAAASAHAIGSRAYTVAHNIVFAAGQHAPQTTTGRRLFVHELAHVVQQHRGGLPPNPDPDSPLERAAKRAATRTAEGGSISVEGTAAPGVMRESDDDDDDEPSPREREKRRTQQRKRERARAGKQESQLSQEEAERELRALEASYRQPGANQRSVKRKTEDLKRFQKLLKIAGGPQLGKNQRQGKFDELQRTPSKTSGAPQTKHVAGGPQLPGQELRPGQDPYAQPDYSVVRRNKDGTFQRLHVNLKSDQIDLQTPAKARATARAYVDQAIRNSRHLAEGEGIIISFARSPTKDVREAMAAEFFKQGSPVSEVRFGTTTLRSETFKPTSPPATPAPKKAKKRKAAKAKKSVKKMAAPKKTVTPSKATAKTKTKASKPAPAPPAVSTTPPPIPKTAPPPGTTTGDLKVKGPTPSVSTPSSSTATTPKVPPATAPLPSPAQIVRQTKVPKVTPGTTSAGPGALPLSGPKLAPGGGVPVNVSRGNTFVRGGGMRGGGMRGAAGAEGAAALVEAIAVPIISHYMQEHYAQSIADEARQLITKAIEDHRPNFETAIEAQRAEIQAAQAEGREVWVHVAVNTNWQDTDIGRVLTRAYVGRFEIVYEGGPPPKKYSAPRPGGLAGDIFRDLVGTTLSYETYDIVLEGTDPEAQDQRLRRRLVEAKLRSPQGAPPVEFEDLIINALENNSPLDDLRDYTVYRRDQAGMASDAGAGPAAAAYWSRMLALIDGPIDQLIVAARAKNIPLDTLRASALYRSNQAAQASDAGTGAAVSSYWLDVVRAIDAK
ncbi:MAG: eCIS core domain-containing protein [Actinomycetota bacterium]